MKRVQASLIASLLALAGCQSPSFSPHFGLGEGGRAGAVVPQASALAARKGQVTVSFADLLPHRRQLLATLADVDHVDLELLPQAPAASMEQTVQKAQIVAGAVSATFGDVPPGEATFIVSVYDAAGHPIGSARGTVAVTAGETTTVNATIPLAPNFGPTPTPLPSSGGSGGATTGTVQASLGLQDGVTAQPMTLLGRPAAENGLLKGIFPGDAGSFTVLGDHVDRLSASGSLLGQLSGSTHAATWGPAGAAGFAAAPGGNYAMTMTDGTFELHHADGSLVANAPLPGSNGGAAGVIQLAIAADGAAWSYAGPPGESTQGLVKMDAAGTTTKVTTGVFAFDIQPGTGGDVFTIESATNTSADGYVARRDASGHAVWTSARAGNLAAPLGLGVDANGHAWVVCQTTTVGEDLAIAEYAPDGTLLSNHALPSGLGNLGVGVWAFGLQRRMLCMPNGTKYVYFQTNGLVLVKLAADGTTAGVYYAPEIKADNTQGYTIDTNGVDRLLICATPANYTTGASLYLYQLP